MNQTTTHREGVSMSVNCKGERIDFTSHLSNDEALAKLGQMIEQRVVKADFAKGLFKSAMGGEVTIGGWAWIHKIVLDHEPKQNINTTPKAQAPKNNLLAVINLFDHAAEHLKWPSITVSYNGEPLELKRAGNQSKNPGCVYITDGGPKGENKDYGKINRDGTVSVSGEFTDGIRKILDALANDPAGFAAQYGKRTGRCCFCNRTLTDDKEGRSVDVGYGPKCASNFHLPWGVKGKAEKQDTRTVAEVEEPITPTGQDHTAPLNTFTNEQITATVAKLVETHGVEGARVEVAKTASANTTDQNFVRFAKRLVDELNRQHPVEGKKAKRWKHAKGDQAEPKVTPELVRCLADQMVGTFGYELAKQTAGDILRSNCTEYQRDLYTQVLAGVEDHKPLPRRPVTGKVRRPHLAPVLSASEPIWC